MRDKISRLETLVRMLSVLLALDMAKNFVSPALWIVGEVTSVIGRTAMLASFPNSLAYGWLAAALLVAPYVLVQVFFPAHTIKRRATKLACRGLALGGVLWVYLAYLSKNLDYPYATGLFTLNGIASVALAAVLAYGLNSDQLQAEQNESYA